MSTIEQPTNAHIRELARTEIDTILGRNNVGRIAYVASTSRGDVYLSRVPRGVLTVNLFRDDIQIRLPDWPGLIFGDLVWRPVSTHRMRV